MHKDERTSSTHQRLRKAQRDEAQPQRFKDRPDGVGVERHPAIRRQVPLRAAQVHLYAAVALAAVCVTILVLVLTS